MGGIVASAPVLMTTVADSSNRSPTASRPGPSNRASPSTKLRFLIFPTPRYAPSRIGFTTSSLRRTIACRSAFASPTTIPNSAARRTWCMIFAEWIMVLVGMQPRFRQVPPRSSFSTNAVFLPFRAAFWDKGRPAIPPPITIRSYCSTDTLVMRTSSAQLQVSALRRDRTQAAQQDSH